MSAKTDILKQINKAVKRKETLAKESRREKTVISWVCDFFSEIEKTRNIDGDGQFGALALSKLNLSLRSIDRKSYAVFKDSNDPQVEIHWSQQYVMTNNCEAITVLDNSSALFQDTLDRID